MSKFYTYEAWQKEFKPLHNYIRANGDLAYETYGEELDYLKTVEPNHIWTEVDGEGGTYILSGFHYVNRIQYYVTMNPWTDDMTEVPTWVYRQCDCCDLEEFEDEGYNPNCEECDEGMIDIPIDTVEDLKAIYGDDNNDIIA